MLAGKDWKDFQSCFITSDLGQQVPQHDVTRLQLLLSCYPLYGLGFMSCQLQL
jgi:hypothetical protein